MTKLNHSGVAIEIPDDNKQEAILTFKDGTELRVGRKIMPDQSAFISYLEHAVERHRQASHNASAIMAQAASSKVMFGEAVQAVDDLKIENYKDEADPAATFVAVAQQRLAALMQYKAQTDHLSQAHSAARYEVDDIEVFLAKVETG